MEQMPHAEDGVDQFARQHHELISQAGRQVDDPFIFRGVAPAVAGRGAVRKRTKTYDSRTAQSK